MTEEIQNNLELFSLVCLSIATKEIEYNCNYVSFFVDVVLPNYFNKIYSKKVFIAKEMQVLMTLNFKILNTNIYDFNMIFLSLFNLSSFDESYSEIIKNTNRQVLFKYLIDDNSATKSPLNVCLDIIKETFVYAGQSLINFEKFNILLYHLITPEAQFQKNETIMNIKDCQNYLI